VTWLGLYSTAVIDFKLSDAEFWKLTPAKFSALADRFDAENFRNDLRAGIVASVIANVNRGEKTKPFSPKDFMPCYGDEEPEKPKQTRADVWALISVVKSLYEGTK